MNIKLFNDYFNKYHNIGYNLTVIISMGRKEGTSGSIHYSELYEFREGGLLTHNELEYRDNISSFTRVKLTEAGKNLILLQRL
jgi:hypothetical protein